MNATLQLRLAYTPSDLPSVAREASEDWSAKRSAETHSRWWEARITRQKEMDASIAAKADYEYLYDKPYEDNRKSAGGRTVHRR